MIIMRLAIIILTMTLPLIGLVKCICAQQSGADLVSITAKQRKTLEQKTAQIDSELNALTKSESISGIPSSDNESAIDELKQSLMISRARVDTELAQIRLQLEEEFRRQSSRTQQDAAAQSIPLSLDRRPPSVPTETLVEQELPPQAAKASEENIQEPTTPHVLGRTGLVAAEVVDQLKLADNLYSIGENQNALEFYQQLTTKTKDYSASLWIKYQIASCQRRLKNYDEAETLLRELANEPHNELPIRAARWWLSAIERRKNIENDISLIQQILTGWDGQLDEINE